MKHTPLKHFYFFLHALAFLSRIPGPALTPVTKSEEASTEVKNNDSIAQQEKSLGDKLDDGQNDLQDTSDHQDAGQSADQATHGGIPQELVGAVAYFPVVGILLGAVLVLPFALGLAKDLVWLGAWLYVAAWAWLSRGLHWDGLADISDACSSNAKGEKFWTILKDSHLGALGGLSLMLVLSGYIIAAYYAFAKEAWLVLIFAAALGRTMPIVLAAISSPHPQASLGKILQLAPAHPLAIFWTLTLFLLGGFFISWLFSALAILLSLKSTAWLSSLSGKHGGYNGDFLGTSIVISELLATLAALFVL